MAREYELTISAVLGRGTADVLAPWVVQAQRAKAQIDAILSAPPKTAARAGKDENAQRVAEAKKAAAELERIRERENNQILKDVEKRLSQEERAAERAAKHVAAIKERYLREEQRRGEKADAEQANRRQKIASDSFSNMRRVASAATRVAGELTAGFGVSFDLSSAMQRGAGLEKMAVDLVNQGNRGTGTASERDAQAQALQTQARAIGDKYRVDPSKVIGGLAQFQAKTGDLETGTAGIERFARLAKAFNVDLDQMISAAGEVSSKLEDTWTPGEKRAQKTYEILKKLTAQGQEGAIEIADLAKETARIGGGAGFFKGDVGNTIEKLSALAQLARQTGGANSAADAARSVAAFVTTMKTPARRKAFDANKVDYQDKDGSFLDPFVIIKNALRATQGDPQKQIEKMNEMFKSSLGTKPVDALAKAYRGAGGGEAGEKAVDALLAKFSQTVGEGAIDENVERANETRESKAQAFQNKLDVIADSLANRVLPAFEKLAPEALKVAEALAGIVSWAASNPFSAVGLAISGSIAAAIAKAAIGDAIGKAVAGGIGSKGLAAGTIVATVATAYLMVREFNKEREAAGSAEKMKTEETDALLARAKSQMANGGKVDKDTMNEIVRRRSEIEGRMGEAGRYDANEDIGFFKKIGAKIASNFTDDDPAKMLAEYEGRGAQNSADKAKLSDQAAKFDALIAAVVESKQKGPMDVNIVGGLPSPTAPTGGTVPQ